MGFGTFKLTGDTEVNNDNNPNINKVDETAEKRKKEIKELVHEALNNVIDNTNLKIRELEDGQKSGFLEEVMQTVNGILDDGDKHLSLSEKQNVASYIMDEIFGYGPITPLLEDPTITEVMVNGWDKVFIERAGKIEKTENTFRDNMHVMHIIEKIIAPLGRRIDESSPMVDARLPDGSRVNVIIPPLSLKGPIITIRKFSIDPYTLENLISFGTLNIDMAKLLSACVKGKLNILVSGGTGSGKTTLLNVLSSFIPHNERIITIEDAAELQLQQQHVVTLESRPPNIEGKGRITIRDLVVNSLRMRPDRIIVGEVRNAEALDMLQAMNTGHDGSITTVHANNPRDSTARLETMVMMAGLDLPSKAIREQISSAISLIIQISRYPDGTRKISNISEITGMEGEMITIQDLYIFKQDGYNEFGKVLGKHVPTGIVPVFIDKLKLKGEAVPISMFKSSKL